MAPRPRCRRNDGKNINIATRAALCLTAITLLLIVLAVVAIIQMGEIRKAEQEVETGWMPSSLQDSLIKAGIPCPILG